MLDILLILRNEWIESVDEALVGVSDHEEGETTVVKHHADPVVVHGKSLNHR